MQSDELKKFNFTQALLNILFSNILRCKKNKIKRNDKYKVMFKIRKAKKKSSFLVCFFSRIFIIYFIIAVMCRRRK